MAAWSVREWVIGAASSYPVVVVATHGRRRGTTDEVHHPAGQLQVRRAVQLVEHGVDQVEGIAGVKGPR
jgi:hypothetical protein